MVKILDKFLIEISRKGRHRKVSSIVPSDDRDYCWWVFLVIWTTSLVAAAMNSSGGKTPLSARPPAYKADALAMIRNELSQFAHSGESSSSGQQSPQNQHVSHHLHSIILTLKITKFSSPVVISITKHRSSSSYTSNALSSWSKWIWSELKFFTFHYQTTK